MIILGTIKNLTVGDVERKLRTGAGAFRNPNGRDTRSDKLIATFRKNNKR